MKLSEVAIGQVVRLQHLDSPSCSCVAVLREGGKQGGCAHDLWMAYVCAWGGPEDTDDLPLVVTDWEDASKCSISL